MKRLERLLVLDLDETLIQAEEQPLQHGPDFRVLKYHVYKRPGLDHFLSTCLEWFEVGIWTTGGSEYANAVVRDILNRKEEPKFILSARYAPIPDPCNGVWFPAKEIKRLKKMGYRQESIIMIDDTPQKLRRNYGNGIIVSPFEGDPGDNELELLTDYLEVLGPIENVRSIEKRGWRSPILQINGTGAD